MITEEIQAIKAQINELLDQLPLSERGDYDAFLLAIDLQAELSALIQRKEEKNSEVIQMLIDTALKKQKGLEQLMALNETVKKIWGSLTEGQKDTIGMKGFSIRSVLKKQKQDKINDAIRISNETTGANTTEGQDNPGIQKNAGDAT